MPPEDTSNAVLVERIANVQASLNEIKADMATKTDQSNTHSIIGRVEIALAAEVTARVAGDTKISDRLQLVEDRQEARKFQFAIAIAVGVLGIVFGLVERFLGTGVTS
jgi:hypothetical protein